MSDDVYYAVDRFERDFAVLVQDSGEETSVPRASLSSAIREGTVLRVPVGEGGVPRWDAARVDEAETERRLREAREVLRELRKRDPGGDIEL
ncbi:MAG: DUF3006 domain-containing protein [Gemmatimonadales bacterium]|jgi:hypothetical protein